MADLLSPFAGERATELAERLIGKFGSLGRALSVDPRQIEDPSLAEACRIVHAARRLTEGALRQKLEGTQVRSDDPLLRTYLRALIAPAADERFHAVFLDRDGRYLRDETIASGGVHQIRFRARTLFARALELDAGQLLLAHNHPSGDCHPSAADVEATRTLSAIASALDMLLVDHLIVTRSSVFSFSDGGLL